jgi:uncharacterized damage-inducible protein DinB
MDLSDIRKLYAYNLWANTRLFSALSNVTQVQFAAPVQSSFPSLRETTYHILGAEWLWLKRWKGQSPRPAPGSDATKLRALIGMPSPEELATVAALQSFADAIEKERYDFLDRFDDATIQADLNYNDMAGTPSSLPLVQLLQHVVNHGTYHRGQATTLLRQLGAETVSLDMLYFFRETAAAAQKM